MRISEPFGSSDPWLAARRRRAGIDTAAPRPVVDVNVSVLCRHPFLATAAGASLGWLVAGWPGAVIGGVVGFLLLG
jgi:hypothetical protein